MSPQPRLSDGGVVGTVLVRCRAAGQRGRAMISKILSDHEDSVIL